MKKDSLKTKKSFEKFVGKVELDKKMLTNTRGAVGDGWVRSMSGECMITPKSCWAISTWLMW
jgi:hypothetical protein